MSDDEVVFGRETGEIDDEVSQLFPPGSTESSHLATFDSGLGLMAGFESGFFLLGLGI